MRTVASHYLKSALETCVAEGCDRRVLLSMVPGGQNALDDVLLRFPVAVFTDLLRHAEELLGATGIGIKIGQGFRPSTFLDFGYAMMACSTLRHVLEFNRAYQSVNQQLGRAKLVIDGRSAFIVWESPDDAEYVRPATETVLTGYVGIGKWITWTHGEDILAIKFRHQKPTHADLLDAAFDCAVQFNQPFDMIEINASIVDQPLPGANPPLVDRLSRRLDNVLLSMDDPNSARLAVYRILERSLAEGRSTITYVSEQIGLSERTLRRRLAEEQQNFRTILSQVRRDVCEIYMNEPNRSMVEVSQLLGYSEHSAFIRAFKGWFGMTPTEYMSLRSK